MALRTDGAPARPGRRRRVKPPRPPEAQGPRPVSRRTLKRTRRERAAVTHRIRRGGKTVESHRKPTGAPRLMDLPPAVRAKDPAAVNQYLRDVRRAQRFSQRLRRTERIQKRQGLGYHGREAASGRAEPAGLTGGAFTAATKPVLTIKPRFGRSYYRDVKVSPLDIASVVPAARLAGVAGRAASRALAARSATRATRAASDQALRAAAVRHAPGSATGRLGDNVIFAAKKGRKRAPNIGPKLGAGGRAKEGFGAVKRGRTAGHRKGAQEPTHAPPDILTGIDDLLKHGRIPYEKYRIRELRKRAGRFARQHPIRTAKRGLGGAVLGDVAVATPLAATGNSGDAPEWTRLGAIPYELVRTAVEDPEVWANTADSAKAMIAGIPIGLAYAAQPKNWDNVIDMMKKDLARRYGPLLAGDTAKFRRIAAKEGYTPYFLDALAAGGGSSQIVGRAGGAGVLGRNFQTWMTRARPDLRLAKGVTRRQRVSRGLAGRAGQYALDRRRAGRYAGGKHGVVAPHLLGENEVAPLSGRLGKLALKRHVVELSGRNRLRGRALKVKVRKALVSVQAVTKHIPRNLRNQVFKEVYILGLNSGDALAKFAERRARMVEGERHRLGYIPPPKPDEVPRLKQISQHPEYWTPELRAKADTIRDMVHELGLLDPALHASMIETREWAALAQLLGPELLPPEPGIPGTPGPPAPPGGPPAHPLNTPPSDAGGPVPLDQIQEALHEYGRRTRPSRRIKDVFPNIIRPGHPEDIRFTRTISEDARRHGGSRNRTDVSRESLFGGVDENGNPVEPQFQDALDATPEQLGEVGRQEAEAGGAVRPGYPGHDFEGEIRNELKAIGMSDDDIEEVLRIRADMMDEGIDPGDIHDNMDEGVGPDGEPLDDGDYAPFEHDPAEFGSELEDIRNLPETDPDLVDKSVDDFLDQLDGMTPEEMHRELLHDQRSREQTIADTEALYDEIRAAGREHDDLLTELEQTMLHYSDGANLDRLARDIADIRERFDERLNPTPETPPDVANANDASRRGRVAAYFGEDANSAELYGMPDWYDDEGWLTAAGLDEAAWRGLDIPGDDILNVAKVMRGLEPDARTPADAIYRLLNKRPEELNGAQSFMRDIIRVKSRDKIKGEMSVNGDGDIKVWRAGTLPEEGPVFYARNRKHAESLRQGDEPLGAYRVPLDSVEFYSGAFPDIWNRKSQLRDPEIVAGTPGTPPRAKVVSHKDESVADAYDRTPKPELQESLRDVTKHINERRAAGASVDEIADFERTATEIQAALERRYMSEGKSPPEAHAEAMKDRMDHEPGTPLAGSREMDNYVEQGFEEDTGTFNARGRPAEDDLAKHYDRIGELFDEYPMHRQADGSIGTPPEAARREILYHQSEMARKQGQDPLDPEGMGMSFDTPEAEAQYGQLVDEAYRAHAGLGDTHDIRPSDYVELQAIRDSLPPAERDALAEAHDRWLQNEIPGDDLMDTAFHLDNTFGEGRTRHWRRASNMSGQRQADIMAELDGGGPPAPPGNRPPAPPGGEGPPPLDYGGSGGRGDSFGPYPPENLLDVKRAAGEAGLVTPGYFPSQLTPRLRQGTKSDPLWRFSGPREYTGKLFRLGIEDPHLDTLRRGVEANIDRRVTWETAATVFTEGDMGYKGPITKQWADMQRDGLDPNDFVWISARKVIDSAEDPNVSFDQAVAEWSTTADGVNAKFKSANDLIAVPKAMYDGLVDAPGMRTPSGLGRVNQFLKTKASRVILGSNPTWLMFQILSNVALTGLARTGPMDIIKAQVWWAKLAEEERAAVEPYLGQGHFAWDVDTPQLLGRDTNNRFVNAYRAFKGTRVGTNLGKANPLNWMFKADHAQNSFFRRSVLYSQIKRDAYHSMGKNMGKIDAAQERLTNILRLGPEDQMKAIMKDPKAMQHHAEAVNEFLGDYLTFTPHERAYLGANVMFYAFLRFSLRFTFYTMPVRHPTSTAILGKLGQMDPQETEKMIGKGFLPYQLGKYFFQDGKMVVDLSRANPALSAFTQSATPLQLMASLMPPHMSWLIFQQGATVIPFTGGKVRVNKDTNPKDPLSWGAFEGSRAEASARQYLTLWWPYRTAERIIAAGRPPGADHLIFSPEYTDYKRADIVGNIKERQKKIKSQSLARRLANEAIPFLPRPSEEQDIARNRAEKGRRRAKKRVTPPGLGGGTRGSGGAPGL